ncbi:hypothetical protein CPB84DRAFT_1752619 [Gymnopilus junonius]|uniref:Uncharacterized protein n=1 Tax=Gymnopilus junonius TaxID=109634 RepID=A0A9P5NA97_GYMJU|nr:hypothetical protein CPB84DRAFT_1752619 [Gymnopilus junonius]
MCGVWDLNDIVRGDMGRDVGQRVDAWDDKENITVQDLQIQSQMSVTDVQQNPLWYKSGLAGWMGFSVEAKALGVYGKGRSKWLPRSLDLLFGGSKEEQTQCLWRQQAYTEEARLMELLADEEADKDPMPDDGKLEGSGGDFKG